MGTPTEGFSCSCEPLRGNECVLQTHYGRGWDETECCSHANEGGGKYSCGPEQSTVKASLVLTLNSAAGFTWHSGKSKGML